MKIKIHKGDKVLVIAGKDKHKTGLVEAILPKANKAIVAGVGMVKKHMKKSAKFPQGGIIDKSMPIHISNLMLLDPSTNKPTRVGFSIQGDQKVRQSRVSGEQIKTGEKS